MHPSTQAILQFFKSDHLPAGPMRDVSAACGVLAASVASMPELEGAELTAGLRKLLEAKDCFVRAALPK